MIKPFSIIKRRILYFAIIIFLILITSVIVFNNIKNFRKTIIQQWQQQMEYSTKLASLNVESFIGKFSDNLLVISKNPKLLSRFDKSSVFDTTDEQTCYICNLYEVHKKDVEAIYLIDTMENIIVSFPSADQHEFHIDYAKVIETFRTNPDMKSFVDVDFHPKSQSSLVYIAAPVFKENILLGVLLWEISIEKIVSKYINPFIDEDKTGYLWLIDSNLNILSHHDNNYAGLNVHYILTDFDITGKVGKYNVKKSMDFINESKLFFDKIIDKQTGSGNYIDFAHAEFSYAVYRKIRLINQNWTIILSMPYSTIFEPVVANNLKTYVYEFIFIGLLVIISFIFFRLEQRSIQLQKESEYSSMLAKSAEELQKEKQKRLTALIDGQEKERSRISRELHDSLGQQLLAIKIKLENSVDKESEQNMEYLKMITKAIYEARSISKDLAPVELIAASIENSIKDLALNFSKSSNIKTDFVSFGIKDHISPHIKIYLYRICQEAFSNIIKHSKATQVDIQLLGNNDQISLFIQDNGIGFDTTEQTKFKGNGLNNIIERVNILKGTYEIISKPSQGTIITIKVNLI